MCFNDIIMSEIKPAKIRRDEVPEPPPGSIVLRSFKDFKFVESKVYPPGAAPEIQNIQQVAPAWFKFILRHRGTWYDGDRDLKNNKAGKDKSRAETAGYGRYMTPFEMGSTWLIGTTVRLDPGFVPSRGYSNILQPTNHQTFLTLTALKNDVVTAKLNVFENGIGTRIHTARTVTFKRGEWTTLVVKIAFGRPGYVGLSINGDAFVGIKIDTSRSGDRKPPFGGNAGLYGSATRGVDGKPLGDQIVEHRNMFIKHLDGPLPRK